MIKELQNIQVHSSSQAEFSVERRVLNGRDYFIVPVVMMVEGVHNGSAGPILHLPENFSQNASDWNGIPATSGHPQNNGEYVLVDDSQRELWVVGYIDDARIEDNKLKANVYIDEQRALAVNPEIVNYINEGKPFDVSTGAVTRDSQESGQHNGEQYEAVTMDYFPDHLALLPGSRGACSWSDGCGIRNNEQNRKEESNEMNQLTKADIQALKSNIKKGIGVSIHPQTNESGFMELASKIQTRLDRMDSEARYYFLKEVFNDYFIYEMRDRDQGTAKYYRQEYSVENSEVSFDGNAMEVRKNVEYLPMQSNQDEAEEDCGCEGIKRTKFNNNQNDEEEPMSDKNKAPSGEVMDQVVSLINNEGTRFDKSDREWLLNLNEAQLSKLAPTEPEAPEVTREQALQALSEDLADAEKLKGILPDTTREKFETGLKAYNDQREKLVKAIQSNTAEGTWPEDELAEMSTQNLERLAKSVQKTDYSGQGPANQLNHDVEEDDLMLPVGVELKS